MEHTLASSAWRRRTAIAAFIFVAALMFSNVVKFAISARRALGNPYELDYGEGIVWQQMDNMIAGGGYSPLGVFPAIVYHYPPIYHLVVALTASTGLDALVAGRIVSALATLVCVMLIAWIAASTMPVSIGRRARIISATLGGVSFLGSPTVLAWSSLMRVDMMACALTLAGIAFTAAALRSHRFLPWAALAFALAVYTKQTAVAGPAAAFVALWIARPRTAWAFAVMCGGLGVAALVLLTIESHGGFLRHVLLYNINRFDPARWKLLVATLATQTISIAVGLAAVMATLRQLRPLDWRRLRSRIAAEPVEGAQLLALLYFVARTALLPTTLKSGASDNYLIDWFAILAVFVGISIARVADAVLERGVWPRAFSTVLVLVGLPVQAYRLDPAFDGGDSPNLRADSRSVVALIRKAPRPVISDDMVLLRRAGRPVLFEPAIIAELAHAGLYNEPALVAKIRQREFAFFVTQGVRGTTFFDERYNRPVADAMDANYPKIDRHGDLVLHFPLH